MVNIRSKFMKAIGVILSAGCVTSSVCVKAMIFLTDTLRGYLRRFCRMMVAKKR